MLKKRFNLRILAAIVACLAVTAVFASCDKDKDGDGDDNGGSGKIDHPIVGVWSNIDFSSSLAKTFYDAPKNSMSEIIETIKNESNRRFNFVEVYRENGTAYTVSLENSTGFRYTYSWTTFNYTVRENTIHSTSNVQTFYDREYSFTSYENKSFPNAQTLFKIRVNSGKEQFTSKPQFEEGTEEYSWTIDEWIEKGNPTWLIRLK